MNESHQWQPPVGSTGSGESAGDAPAVPPAGGAVTPPSGPAASGDSTTPGWTPPPKPGLIPLRPLDLGSILAAAFKTLRHNPRPTLGTALLVQGVVTVISIGVIGLVTFLTLSRIDNATGEARQELIAGSIGTIILSAIIPVLLSLAASALVQGVIVLDVMRASLGEKPRLRQLLRMAHGRVWALIGWTALVSLVLLVGFGVLALIVVGIGFAIGGIGGVLAGVLLGLFLGLGAVVLSAWIYTKLSLVPSVLMAERTSIRGAMARSWALTQRSFWKTFGIELLVAVMISVATQVITTPISFVGGLLTSLADPNGQNPATSATSVIGIYVVVTVITVVVSAIGAIVQSATIALLYIDLRMRKEGLDLELARFVEARQSGASGLVDPFAASNESPRA